MPKAKPGLRLSRYQELALKADKSPDDALAFPLLGLFGEAGSLLSIVKKKHRYTPHVVEELDDVLWYFTAVASRGGVAWPTLPTTSTVTCPTGRQEAPPVRFGSFSSFHKRGEHVRFTPNSRRHSRHALRSA